MMSKLLGKKEKAGPVFSKESLSKGGNYSVDIIVEAQGMIMMEFIE